MAEEFSFFVNGYKFNPKYQAGFWDGKISMIDSRSQKARKGLLPEFIKYCENLNIDYEIDEDILGSVDYKINDDNIKAFYRKIKAPYIPHEAQIKSFKHCIENQRGIILAPTSNGKSYTIHGLCMFHALKKQKILIIIDRVLLVSQLKTNMLDEYNGSDVLNIETSKERDTPSKNCNVYITTSQSARKHPPEWYNDFDVIIGDEIHKFAAKTILDIFDKCPHIATRYGFTATLDNDSKTNRLTLIGLFAQPLIATTNKKQIEAGIASKPTIYAIILKYSKEDREAVKKMDFTEERNFVENHEKRIEIISKLNDATKGNTLIAFRRIEQGKNIYDYIKENHKKDTELFYSDGKTKSDIRTKISEIIDKIINATGVLSVGTFGTGVNIKNINNIIIACQIKSAIDVVQLIGRGLRKSNKKDTVKIFDFMDDLSIGKTPNILLSHSKTRLRLYKKEGFKIVYKIINL